MKTLLKSILLAALCFITITSTGQSDNSNKEIENECLEFLKQEGKNPLEYVISKFEKYDYIFLGEYHRIRQDVNFVRSLIPELYKNGVTTLAIEFYGYKDGQSFVDSTLVAKDWNENAFYKKISTAGSGVIWGYTEYIDLMKDVWRFNKQLPEGKKKFRIVLFGTEFYPCEDGDARFGNVGDPDVWMASVFEKEVISKNEKALVYCGLHHAFTRYHQPIYDFDNDELQGHNSQRFGNVIYQKYPEKTFNILLHHPLYSDKGFDKPVVKPANGTIDHLMSVLNNKPLGFDLAGTCMGKLRSDNTYYKYGYTPFLLENFYDGYIFLVPLKELKAVEVIPNYYSKESLDIFKELLRCVNFPKEKLDNFTAQDALEIIKSEGNIEKNIKHLTEKD